ncbi:putative bifunctional diguanylate cyclase/phosphodiesterase [Aestuariirhabdus litorea]|nr:bifunctional diguanylate cyclase/phosphodiesterase [Aestuariirhabdus litorea]RWW92993.1 EAL domain-containing protein [Endozoicomonadaceae bacterium GTF-13]
MRFMSLRWKSLVLYTLLLLTLLGSLTALTLVWFDEYQRSDQQARVEEQRSNIERVLRLNSQMVIRSLESFLDQGRDLLLEGGSVSMAAAFSGFWESNALRNDYEHAWLFDTQGAVLAEWGAPHPFRWQQGVSDVLRNLAPVEAIRCKQLCLHYTALPAHWSGSEERVLVIASSLIQPVISLREVHRVDIALLITDSGSRFGDWPVRIQSLSNRPLLEPVLREASARYGLSELVAGSRRIAVNDHYYLLWSQPLGSEPESGQLLFIEDVTQQEEALNHYLWQVSLLALAILLVGQGIGTLAYSAPIRRLNLQARALPLLAYQRFDEARALLRHEPAYVADELDQLEAAGVQLADQLEALTREVQQRTEQLEKMALFDPLTGLPNRNWLLQFLSRSLQTLNSDQQLLAVLLLDLDDFRRINNTLGHAIGDNLLVALSQRLANRLQGREMVGRFGGDVFVVILPQAQSRERVLATIDSLMEEIRQPLQLLDQTFVIAASLGVTFASPQHQGGAEELIKQADTAMHEAKARGKNMFCIFDKQMTRSVETRVAMEQELRQAVEQRQFCLHLQPQVSLASGHLTGFEALIRWRHPQQGLLAPAAFLIDLENSEHNIPVGFWVIEHGLEILASLCRHTGLKLKLAINMNPELFLDKRLTALVQQQLARQGLAPSQLELELTESLLVEDMGAVAAQMAALARMGVTIAIDDFGTGYSSLAYLRQLPVDVLKIDRSFVANVPGNQKDALLVCSILSMAKQLQLQVVAEGIENPQQAEFLRQQGCPLGQGFGIARPIDETELLAVLDARLQQGRWLDVD